MKKHFTLPVATFKGHLDQTRMNLRSTHFSWSNIDSEPQSDHIDAPNSCGLAIMEMQNKVYMDQTGQFPVQSYRGYKYIMVMLHCDSNAILATPLNQLQTKDSQSNIISSTTRLHHFCWTSLMKNTSNIS